MGWEGEWLDSGTYNMKFRSAVFDMWITGDFSTDTITGGGIWPHPQESERGLEFAPFMCSRFETTAFHRIEWTFSGSVRPRSEN